MSTCYHARQSFNDILNEHKTLIDYAVGPYRSKFRTADIDDITCDAEYGLYLAWCRYDPTRGITFKAFAAYMIRQTIKDGFRQRWYPKDALNAAVSFDILDDCTEPSPRSFERGYQQIEDREMVSVMMASLDEQSHQLIRLRFFDGLKMTEIAERTGLSLGFVRCHIYRTLKTLAEKFNDNDRHLRNNNSRERLGTQKRQR